MMKSKMKRLEGCQTSGFVCRASLCYLHPCVDARRELFIAHPESTAGVMSCKTGLSKVEVR